MRKFCQSPLAVNGEHAGEYFEVSHGEVWEKCVNCSALFFVRYEDHNGC